MTNVLQPNDRAKLSNRASENAAASARGSVVVATTWDELDPGNLTLRRQGEAAAGGVWAAGGVPREISLAGPPEAVAPAGDAGVEVAGRTLLVDTLEYALRGREDVGIVVVAGSGTAMAGALIGICRLDIAGTVVPGGSTIPGSLRGRSLTALDVALAARRHDRLSLGEDELTKLIVHAWPGSGVPPVQSSAGTMACALEGLGLAVAGCSGPPAIHQARDRFAHMAGETVIDMATRGVSARDIVSTESIENALAVVAATGGSADAVVHLLAIAEAGGVVMELDRIAEVLRSTPRLADLLPNGGYDTDEFFHRGGVGAVIGLLLNAGVLHGECPTVSGATLQRVYGDVVPYGVGGAIIDPAWPLPSTIGVLRGDIAPQGALWEVPASAPRHHTGRVVTCVDADSAEAVAHAGVLADGSLLVVTAKSQPASLARVSLVGEPGRTHVLIVGIDAIDGELLDLDLDTGQLTRATSDAVPFVAVEPQRERSVPAVSVVRAVRRSAFRAMGLDDADVTRPWVGVASVWNGLAPAGAAPLELGAALEEGAWSAGAAARRFAVCGDAPGLPDGVVGRDLVADAVVFVVHHYGFEAFAGIAASERDLAGLMLAACRVDRPTSLVALCGPAWGNDEGTAALATAAFELGLSSGQDLTAMATGHVERAIRAAGEELLERLANGVGARAGIGAQSLRRAAAAAVAAGGTSDLLVHLYDIAAACDVPLTWDELCAAADGISGGPTVQSSTVEREKTL